jgi:hypothetical protein
MPCESQATAGQDTDHVTRLLNIGVIAAGAVHWGLRSCKRFVTGLYRSQSFIAVAASLCAVFRVPTMRRPPQPSRQLPTRRPRHPSRHATRSARRSIDAVRPNA